MYSFKNFINENTFVESVLSEFNDEKKVWSAKKAEILKIWNNIRPDVPIIIQPVFENPYGDNSSYDDDGIRITGSWNFISSILARIKQIIGYENSETRLRLVFRSVEKQSGVLNNRQSYVFYINLERRSKRKKKLI